MKLFKSLLVAPATLGLLAPISANATEINLNEISNYSGFESVELSDSFNNDDSKINSLLAGGEGLVDDHSHDGGFSETTTASFGANFYLGATDTDDGSSTLNDSDDAISAGYDFQIGLNTSFTGEDSLDITIDAGNAGTFGEFDSDNTGDILMVDGVSYTFPIGSVTAFVGDNTDGSLLFTTACVYGGPSNTLDDCGNVNAAISGGETSFGASYDFGNGFTASAGVQTGNEVLTEETQDAYALNAAYTGENYGLSITYASGENATRTDDDTVSAFQAYYTPEGLPSISVGYEVGELGGVASDKDGFESFFVGLTWDEVGPGSAGIAVGHSSTAEGSEEEYMYEAYYEYPVNDGMTITPLIFIQEKSTAGIDDSTGVMVKTSFSF